MYKTEEQAKRINFSLSSGTVKGKPKPDNIEVSFDPPFKSSNRLVRTLGFTPKDLVDGIKEACSLLPEYHKAGGKETLYFVFDKGFSQKYSASEDLVKMLAREHDPKKPNHPTHVLFETTAD